MSDADSSNDHKKKKKDVEPPEHHTGSKVPADRPFAEWINRQWRLGEKLQRIDVIEYFSKGNQKGYGNTVDFEIFVGGHEVDMEEAVDLSNRMHGNAQINCDRMHSKLSEMTYYARAYDVGRGSIAEPIDTFPLLVRPNPNKIFIDKPDEEQTSQQLALEYLRQATAALQFDRQREDQNTGEIIAMLLGQIHEGRVWELEQHKMMISMSREWFGTIKEMAALLSQEQDRLPQRELVKIKSDILRDGWKVGRNVLTGLIGGYAAKDATENGSANNGANNGGNGGNNGANRNNNGTNNNNNAPYTRLTPERMLIDNFFEDCAAAKLDILLFGEWEQAADGPKCTKPGIFTADQFLLLKKVHMGYLPAEALDDLLFGSGEPVAVTLDQLRAAQALDGMTDGIASSLGQMIMLREGKKKKVSAASAAPAPDPIPATAHDEGKEDADV